MGMGEKSLDIQAGDVVVDELLDCLFDRRPSLIRQGSDEGIGLPADAE